eukprot:CAMPEP_0168512464 /NCGR_PEP_ID=MMETSP0405-20121227/2798_1 /TAXON_ID=498012 /ORGANISM="Trichosphaerium sp, Strain Am-I-7 wt" /LENGTH=53 /DNA_ID=CAMNT_0008530941 /DNA_START=607 /DNA_END=768 /DNA_ORIENTATION=-
MNSLTPFGPIKVTSPVGFSANDKVASNPGKPKTWSPCNPLTSITAIDDPCSLS